MSETKETIVSRLQSFFRLQDTFLNSFLNGKSEEMLKRRFFDEKWSAWEQFCHIVRYQEMFSDRITDILDGKSPYYDAYQPDNDPKFQSFHQHTIQELVILLQRSREQILGQVTDKVGHLESTGGTHSKFGTLQAEEWVEFFMLHALHHWYEVQKQVLLNRK